METSTVRLRTLGFGSQRLTRRIFKQIPHGAVEGFENANVLGWVRPDGTYWLLFEANGRLHREWLIVHHDWEYVQRRLAGHEQIYVLDQQICANFGIISNPKRVYILAYFRSIPAWPYFQAVEQAESPNIYLSVAMAAKHEGTKK